VSKYLPASNLPDVLAAVESAASSASQTNMTLVWESVVMGPTPPAYLTDLPTQYQTQLVGLESAMGALRDSIVSSAAAAVSRSAVGIANATSATTSHGSVNSTRAVVSSPVGATNVSQSSSVSQKSASTVSTSNILLFTGDATRLVPGAVSILGILWLMVVL